MKYTYYDKCFMLQWFRLQESVLLHLKKDNIELSNATVSGFCTYTYRSKRMPS